MPPDSISSTPATAPPPHAFCKACGYPLIRLPSQKCPECGRPFDPTNPRTFARRPPRSTLRRWARRLLALMLLSLLTAGAGIGWLWWGWRAEQPTIARLGMPGQLVHVAPIGPQRLRWMLGERLGYLTDRVDLADLGSLEAAETKQLDFGSLSHIQMLSLFECELSNSNLSHLAGLAKLENLRLINIKIETPDLAFLEKLPALSTLVLAGKWVPKSSLEHIGRLGHLKRLSLSKAGVTDADLQHLQGLSSLALLNLSGNPISDDGLEYLQGLKSLRVLRIDDRLSDSPGMAKLKQAIPGLQVN